MLSVLAKFSGIRNKGESLRKILSYWIPEVISNTILVTLPPLVDSWIIAQLGSITLYGAVGMGASILHTLVKLSEAIPVAAIAIIGRHNGAKEYEKCGEDLGDTFWTTFIMGFFQFALFFLFADNMFHWLGVSDEMVAYGTPFLKVKSFGYFLAFFTLGLIGFMRAIKNTRFPMILNIIGVVSFVFFDYTLVLGKCFMPQMGLFGSAIATVIQYGVMAIIALIYLLTKVEYRKYFQRMFFLTVKPSRMLHLLNLSWPIIIDKSTITLGYIWLAKMIAPLGEQAIATFDVVNKLERSAFVPVMASATVITFLVSNTLGARDNQGATDNIKKIYLFTCATVFPILILLCLKANYFVSFFDPGNKFTYFAATALTPVSLLVFFDITQVFLAGALRGAGDVRFVMWSRVISCSLLLAPAAYIFHLLPGISNITKFILIYGSFYLNTLLLSGAYYWRIKSHKWQNQNV